MSREFLRRSDENSYAGGDVELVLGDGADQQLADGSADTVIFSSIMHEVYSYSGYDRAGVDRALVSAARELRRGGRLLIRDGIRPNARDVLLDLMDASTAAQLERFAREFKHGQGAAFTLAATRAGGVATVRLGTDAGNELLCKKDYLESWDIEVHEEYAVFTVDEWRAVLARNFFSVRTIMTYVNEWIRQNRYQGHVNVTELNGTSFWPATNAVIIGERQ
ncbi:MAG: methyltransferase domain-containing protein [Myxococcales bacterium]|nr:methyltransferase domain-containing protein [Myxococcales bacterium]